VDTQNARCVVAATPPSCFSPFILSFLACFLFSLLASFFLVAATTSPSFLPSFLRSFIHFSFPPFFLLVNGNGQLVVTARVIPANATSGNVHQQPPPSNGSSNAGARPPTDLPVRESIQQRRQRVHATSTAANANLRRPVQRRASACERDDEMRAAKLELMRSEIALNASRKATEDLRVIALRRQLQLDD